MKRKRNVLDKWRFSIEICWDYVGGVNCIHSGGKGDNNHNTYTTKVVCTLWSVDVLMIWLHCNVFFYNFRGKYVGEAFTHNFHAQEGGGIHSSYVWDKKKSVFCWLRWWIMIPYWCNPIQKRLTLSIYMYEIRFITIYMANSLKTRHSRVKNVWILWNKLILEIRPHFWHLKR